MKYTFPCCGYKTLADGTRDSYEICKVCYWEDDFVQNVNPTLKVELMKYL
jgi:hypothetical protein